MKLWMRIALMIVALPLVLIGCRREEPLTGRAPEPVAAASTETALTTADAKLAAEEPIAISIVEGGIVITSEPLAGATDFQVTNDGNQVHSLAIEGEGVSQSLEENLQPLETRTLRLLDLPAGRYQVFCPFPGHADDGETAVMNVEKASD